jgi:hypothetical protein
MSDKEIYNLVGLYFQHINRHMRLGNFIRIDELGDFGISIKEKRRRLKEDDVDFTRKDYERRLRNRRKCYNFRLKQRWKKFNEMRVSKELAPWKFSEWRTVHKSFKMRRKSGPKVKIKK